MNKADRIATIMNPFVKKLIEFSIAEGMENPKFSVEAEVKDGFKYRLVFERTDLDETILENE